MCHLRRGYRVIFESLEPLNQSLPITALCALSWCFVVQGGNRFIEYLFVMLIQVCGDQFRYLDGLCKRRVMLSMLFQQ